MGFVVRFTSMPQGLRPNGTVVTTVGDIRRGVAEGEGVATSSLPSPWQAAKALTTRKQAAARSRVFPLARAEGEKQPPEP
jgi:hypothetical protein